MVMAWVQPSIGAGTSSSLGRDPITSASVALELVYPLLPVPLKGAAAGRSPFVDWLSKSPEDCDSIYITTYNKTP